MKEMPITHRGVVYPWQCDHVGHMNVMWFVGKFDEATWNLFALVGMTAAYLAREYRGMAAVEQHLRYRRELRAGDVLVVRSGVIEVKEKALKFYHEMREALSEEIAATAVGNLSPGRNATGVNRRVRGGPLWQDSCRMI
ncbi:MAG: acyl-CoA thioesterase [Deltaproteobacteria bacterium]|nr:acyl-CoA thioesterase [Deltaproteobacteria bacterium]